MDLVVRTLIFFVCRRNNPDFLRLLLGLGFPPTFEHQDPGALDGILQWWRLPPLLAALQVQHGGAMQELIPVLTTIWNSSNLPCECIRRKVTQEEGMKKKYNYAHVLMAHTFLPILKSSCHSLYSLWLNIIKHVLPVQILDSDCSKTQSQCQAKAFVTYSTTPKENIIVKRN